MTGIIVYSHTGNTLSVAEKIKDRLKGSGIEAELVRLNVSGSASNPKGIKIIGQPDLEKYDSYVFASPVQAFGLAEAMKIYLNQITPLNGKTAVILTTQGAKKRWLGGNRSVRKMKELIEKKGGAAAESAIINWSSDLRDVQIEDAVSILCKKLTEIAIK